MNQLHLAFDLSRAPFADVGAADLAAATLDICEWADACGFASVSFAEHHGASDGFLPSPLQLAAAVAARTEAITLAPVIVAPLYDPVRLAEDLAVLDLLSRGRLEPVLVAGYLPSEFAMFGRERDDRVALLTTSVDVLRRSWSGEPFELDGRPCLVLPRPHRPLGPPITLGGMTRAAARRAARIGDRFHPGAPGLWDAYREECTRLGRDPGPRDRRGPAYLHVTRDKDATWDEVGPFLHHVTARYDRWYRDGLAATEGPYGESVEVRELRDNASFQIVTPEECLELVAGMAPGAGLQFSPLTGGIAPHIAWESLRLFEAEVLPHLAVSATRSEIS